MSLLRNIRVDSLEIEFGSPEQPLAEGDHGLERILEILENHAGELKPDKVSMGRRRLVPYSRTAAYKRLSREEPVARDVWVEKTGIPEVELGLCFADLVPNHFSVDAHAAPLDFFADETKAQQVVSFMRALAREYQSLGAFAHGSSDYSLSLGESLNFGPLRHFWELHDIFWLNVLGKELVDKIGRKRALSTPAEHLEELPNGSILFLTRPTPHDFASEVARVAQAKALVHLRPELNYGEVLAALQARSAVFVPVEPHWDPDVAPLFADLLNHTGLTELYPKTARLNALELPPVSEWLPIEAAPLADVDNPEAEIERYEGILAEGLCAVLHKVVPEVMKDTPEALVKVDSALYRLGYARYERSKVDYLATMAGAFLGRVMVQHLGGRWVPRKNLDEAQVIVGDRAFLPFLRARHHLVDEESALRYSLTQLYRFAARHLVERALTGGHERSGGSVPA